MITAFRIIMLIVQIPLWITALPALMSGMMDDYDGDTLWLPSVATFTTFFGLAMIVVIPFLMAWEAIQDRR